MFELYSLETDGLDPTYPGDDQMYVRFFLHNGTDSSTDFVPYPLFGDGPSQTYIPWNDFQDGLETFAVQSTQEWCMRCNAQSVFCTGVLGDNYSAPKGKSGMAPAVAGVIGAVVTLVVVGLAAAVGFFLCGFRNRGGHRASVGGFKGTSKLASDTDVSFHNPIWGSSKTANGREPDEASSGGIVIRGQERLGSWEMGQHRKEIEGIHSNNLQPSAALDDDPEEWRLHSVLQPVKARESV